MQNEANSYTGLSPKSDRRSTIVTIPSGSSDWRQRTHGMTSLRRKTMGRMCLIREHLGRRVRRILWVGCSWYCVNACVVVLRSAWCRRRDVRTIRRSDGGRSRRCRMTNWETTSVSIRLPRPRPLLRLLHSIDGLRSRRVTRGDVWTSVLSRLIGGVGRGSAVGHVLLVNGIRRRVMLLGGGGSGSGVYNIGHLPILVVIRSRDRCSWVLRLNLMLLRWDISDVMRWVLGRLGIRLLAVRGSGSTVDRLAILSMLVCGWCVISGIIRVRRVGSLCCPVMIVRVLTNGLGDRLWRWYVVYWGLRTRRLRL